MYNATIVINIHKWAKNKVQIKTPLQESKKNTIRIAQLIGKAMSKYISFV